ncbi:MAG: methylenetetrahydrofolate reductase [Christensenellaceae bacterium]
MKLNELFRNKKCVFSIECFPPKVADNYPKMQNVLREIKQYTSPDYISVTYGAGGSNNTVSTWQIASFIKNELNIESVAHLTCIGSEEKDVETVLDNLSRNGVQNVLALRGDISPTRQPSTVFRHASDLIGFAKTKGDFCFSGACYPEGHPESASKQDDLNALLIKQESGASHFITQLFFDNKMFFRFLNSARSVGVKVPVSCGIMPIVRLSQIERSVTLSASTLPSDFTKMISRYQDDENSLYLAGIDYASKQIRELIESGADGIHLYAMNNSDVAKKVYDNIKDLL